MAGEQFNRERAARILVDAISLGDRTAAKEHDVCEKTISRYRKRLLTDPELSRLVQEKGREAEHGWHFARARFLRRTLLKLEELVEHATVDDFEQVIAALKAAGEIALSAEALGVGKRAHGPDPPAPEAAVGHAPEGDPDAADDEGDEGAGT